MTPSIQIRDIPARPALLVHGKVPTAKVSAEIGRFFDDVSRWAGQHAVTTTGPAFARYASWGGGQCELDAGFVVQQTPPATDPPIALGSVGGCLAACATHVGPYDKLSDTYALLQKWVVANGYEPIGELWEEYSSPPGTPPGETVTDVFLPVWKAG